MREEVAMLVAKYQAILTVTKNLIQSYSLATIPESLLNNIKYLVANDENARKDFYNIIYKWGEKYNKIYKSKIKDL
jgi:hypothetical protein